MSNDFSDNEGPTELPGGELSPDQLSSDELSPDELSRGANVIGNQGPQPPVDHLRGFALEVFRSLASLRLTVALMAMGIFIVFVGTLAQVEMDMWDVIDKYFRAVFCWIPFQVFSPKSWFPSEFMQSIPGSFPFPGGMSIGVAMAVNLIAAHCIRFKIQGRGLGLLIGLPVIALGVLITGMIIVTGHAADGLQGEMIFTPQGMFQLFVGMTGLLAIAGLAAGVWFAMNSRWAEGITAIFAGLTVIAIFIWVERNDLDDSGMRILWQLSQGLLAGIVLLVGCIFVFRKRAGIVVLHGGIMLLMFGELWVDLQAVEEQMVIREGETVNYARKTKDVELALVESRDGDDEQELTIVIPGNTLERQKRVTLDSIDYGEGKQLELPVEFELVKYFPNSDLVDIEDAKKEKAEEDEPFENRSTTGFGLQYVAKSVIGASGADMEGKVDLASAYVKVSVDGEVAGTYLLSQLLSEQGIAEKLKVNDKTYDMYLRFERSYKPYTLTLNDFQKNDYIGTRTPSDYSSYVVLKHEAKNVDREVRIWMNNPLRYGGETFYQSSFQGDDTTVLQIVTNSGWMIPYVSCMLVTVGMLAHFGMIIPRMRPRPVSVPRPAPVEATVVDPATPASTSRKKKGRKTNREEQPVVAKSNALATVASWCIPVMVALFCFILLFMARENAWNIRQTASEMNVADFGRLPVMYKGRVKPFDTLARNSLKIVCGRESFKDDAQKRQPAIRWLLDVISESKAALEHKVIRIDNLEVLNTLGLVRRSGYRYSVEEILPKYPKFQEEVEEARKLETEELTFYQRKLIELDQRLRVYTLLKHSFDPPNPEAMGMQQVVQQLQSLQAADPPLSVPMKDLDGKKEVWEPFAKAYVLGMMQIQTGQKPSPNLLAMNEILVAYESDETAKFNSAVRRYSKLLAASPPKDYDMEKTRFEHYFNHLSPFFLCSIIYVISGVVVFLSWPLLLVSQKLAATVNRSAFGLIVVALLFHTIALSDRMYISGRPPVTNLYSSAVFIGWAMVCLGIVIEFLVRLGVGNLMSSVAGFSTLLIAGRLAGDGDTFTVLQAVLDTQFWLSTHVVCITLGYAATFGAGLAGMIFILAGIVTPVPKEFRKGLYSITYGIVCFALFFSFFGTVLGGLWADDSWGRFWGWDPKENGALMIVLWNALVLHARWCGMVRERGFAILVVGGNIVTAWSWFGVNELGVGLHSYGFTAGVMLRLACFGALCLFFIGLGCIPKRMWWSYQSDRA